MTFKLCNLSAYNQAQKKNNLFNEELAKLEQMNLKPIEELQHQKYLAWKKQKNSGLYYCPKDIATWLYRNVEGFNFNNNCLYKKKNKELANQLKAIALKDINNDKPLKWKKKTRNFRSRVIKKYS
ncbi:MAG: hypothetical protein ACFBSE_22370 [Prochloraceae cyanobacterium]